MCIGRVGNRSICVCPIAKGGPRCLLPFSCPADFCENNASCLVQSDGMNEMGFVCICPEQFMGVLCQIRKSKIEIAFHRLEVLSSYLLVDVVRYQDTRSQVNQLVLVVIPQKLAMFQRAVSLYTDTAFPLVFVQIDQHYYFASLDRTARCFIRRNGSHSPNGIRLSALSNASSPLVFLR